MFFINQVTRLATSSEISLRVFCDYRARKISEVLSMYQCGIPFVSRGKKLFFIVIY